MRLTALSVCGTLLTFSCLFWITADSDEGVLLGDTGFGPCAATLRPDGLCSQGQHESACPYLFSLPPLTVHLPQQLRELEKIMKDLQKLKDSVDQLREMCADCTVSQTERECGRQREDERLNEGEDGREDERNWMNERLQENDRGFRQGCGKDSVKVEGDGDSEKGRNKWEAERESDKGVIQENEKEESQTEVTEKDGKPQTEGARGKDKLGQTKVPTAGGNERIVDMARGKAADDNNRTRETDRDKDNARKVTSKGYQEDKLEEEKNRKTTPNAKTKEETEEGGHHVWRDETKETEKKTQTEGSDRIKMSEEHDEHTNKEQEQRGEERKKEMEKGIKMERNNEKPKQTESIGHTEKGKTIKEGEGRETGKEIKTEEGKTESVQRDGDGELSSSKAIERTDFVSISPTPHSNIRLASRPDSTDSDKATIFTSSLPSPPLPSSTLDSITDVGHETTQSTGLRAAAISEHPGPDAESVTTISTLGGPGQQVTSATTGFRVRPGAGFQGHSTTTTTSTTTPHQNLYITDFPGATDHSRWTAKKNNSSNIKTGVKPLPGRGPKPGEKHTPGNKPEADQKLKNPRNDHKTDRAPSADKKTKHNQNQKKPSPHKPTTDQSAPSNVPKRVSKPDQRTPPDVLPTDQNPKNNPTPKQDPNRAPDQNKVPIQKPKFHQKAGTPVHRRPPAVNTTRSDKYPLINREHGSDDEIPIINQNSKPEKKLVHILRPDRPGPKPKPEKRPKSEEKTKPQRFELNQNPTPAQEPDSETSETASFTPKPHQRPLAESRDKADATPSLKPNQDSTSAKKVTPDLVNTPPDQRPKPSQQIPKINQKPKPVQVPDSETSETASFTPKPHQRPLAESRDKLDENPPLEPEFDQDSTSAKKITPDRTHTPPDQRPKPSQKIPKVNQNFKPTQEPDSETSETASFTPKPHQRPLTESRDKADATPSLEPNQDSTSAKKVTPDQTHTPPDQRPKPSQKIPKINQKPETVQEPDSEASETASFTPKPHQRPLAESRDKLDENPPPEPNQDSTSAKKFTPNRVNTPPDQRPKPSQRIPKINQKPKPVQVPDSVTSETASFTPKPHQRPPTESRDKADENPTSEPKSNQDSTSAKKVAPDRVNTPPDQRPKPNQKIPKINQKPKPVQEPESETSETASFTPKPHQRPLAESRDKGDATPSLEPNQDSTSAKKITPDQTHTPPDQRPKPSQKIPKINQKPKPVQEPDSETSETGSFTPKPHQRPPSESMDKTGSSPSLEPNQDSTSAKKIIPVRVNNPPDQRSKPSQKIPKVNQKPKPGQVPESETSETASFTPKPHQRPPSESSEKPDENPTSEPKSNQDSTSAKKVTPDRVNTPPNQRPKPSQKIPKINQKPKPGQVPKPNQKYPKPVTGLKTKPNVNPKTGQAPKTNQNLKKPRPGQMANLNPKSVPDEVREAESNKTSKPRPPPRYRPPTRPTLKPGATPVQRPKTAVRPKPSPKTKTHLNLSQISWTASGDIQNSQTDTPPTSSSVKQAAEVTHSPRDTEFSPSMKKTATLGPKTSNSLETGPSPHLHTLPEDSTVSPNSRIMSDLRPQTASQPPSIPMTTRPNKITHGILPSVIPSTSPGSTKPNLIPKSDSSTQAKLHSVEETAPANPVPSPSSQTTSTLSPDFRSTTPATSGPEPPAAESSTPSARELRVKINQVAAFLNNSLSKNGRPPDRHPKEQPEGTQGGSRPDRTDSKLPTLIPSKAPTATRDCSDHLLRGETKSGVYLVTPDLRSRSFPVFCDMEQDGGGWTLLQRRQDGSVSFNRTWAEYQSGFGELDGGEVWLGNNMIHLLTRDRDMVLRVELEDFDGVSEYAQYEQFRVASERQRYRLTVGGYSGTAGDALRFSKRYDHNNRAFTTPDRDHDRYPSGNCGAYYSSGWWFDACMAANLNGRYYVGKYKGVRDGIFWGTWHNISTEYYPTNERQSFKSVRMMIRPKGFAP